MIKFKLGKTYSTRSACNHECIWYFIIERRTDKSIWFRERGKAVKRVKVQPSYDGGYEIFYPFGKYSMCPTVHAGREVVPA